MSFAGRLLLSAGLLLAVLPALRAQPAPPSDDASGAGAPGYTPYQYIPLNSPASAADAETNADDEARKKQLSYEAVANGAPAAPAPNFKPLTAATRPLEADSGFAPVVGTTTGDLGRPELTQSGGGVARVYAPGFRLGPFDIRPDLSVSGTYNDNIYLTGAGQPHTSDFITTINPVLSASFANAGPDEIDGTQFDLTYAPSGLVFQQYDANSSFNQQLSASLSHRFARFRANLSQSYSHISGGLIQAGDLVTQDYYNTSADIDYALTPKTSLEMAGSYTSNSYSTGFGSETYNGSMFLNYELRPKIVISVAPAVNYLDPQRGTGQQTSLGGLFRVAYSYSEKTNFYFQIGGDENQYGGSSLHTLDWNYLGGFQWSAGPKTGVNLTASRSTKSSNITTDQDYTASNVGIAITQALVQQVSVSLYGGYEHSEYFSTVTGDSTFRYDYFSISPAVSYHPTSWSDVGMSYLFRRSLSSNGINEFDNNQLTVFSTVRF